jgi:hypothetical protein
MSNQLAIQAGLSTSGSGYTPAPSRTSAPAASGEEPAKPVALFVNPSFHFDPTVGLEVIQFHDATGTVNSTIPSARQLAAYRSHQATPPGEQAPPSSDAKTPSG